MTLDEQKAAARKAAFARRKEAHSGNAGSAAGMLSSVLAGYRGVPCAGYMPIRTEIDPLPAMAEAAAHGPVGVPVIVKEASPLLFSRWEPDCALVDGPFGARFLRLRIILNLNWLLCRWSRLRVQVGDWGMAVGFMIAPWNCCARNARLWPLDLPIAPKNALNCP